MKAKLPNGMGGGPSNMQGMIRQAQKMQEQMEEKRAELDAREYEVQAGGGAVTVKMNGELKVLSVNISPDVVDPDDIETLEDIVVAAMNEIIVKINTTNNDEMNKITGSMNIPGMPGLF